ncbi:MAG: pyridoxal phosphate-dependent aminotransferase family protein [Calditrichaeota bacterium]|nr:pyridoxal phosphate-dependent aminotransferase family protein [Calditrichota bacterium]
MDLFNKCYNFTRAKEAIEAGIYPYFRPIESGADTQVVINGKPVIMIGSNNYLGLTQDPRVKKAAQDAIEKFGTGCTGSRFLNGTLSLHEELEERLADFMQREAALVFSTGFQTNLGTISTIVGKDDLIFADRENHASIVDGCRLAFGKTVKYRHNDMNDLERLLKMHEDDDAGKLIVSDGVFSMGGDIVDLPRMVELGKQYGARIMIDDAHSVGVLGDHGRGTAEHFGLEDQVDIVMGTFSKSFASIGGFIAGDEQIIHYIKHHSRSLIFSASPPPASVATVLACLDILEKEPERRERLWAVTDKMRKGFKELGFNTGNSETPIIPVIIGDDDTTFAFWKALFDNGVYTNPVISPAVPPGMSLIRTSYMATHTDEELDTVLGVFEKVGKQLGII